jgi:hypothetical protein
MESKIQLYDADGARVGETFTRRARQLVSQQRGEWADESRTSVRFFRDTDGWDTDTLPETFPSVAEAEPRDEHKKDERLLALARKRIQARTQFIKHTVLLIPGYITIIVFGLIFADFASSEAAIIFIGFFFGVWTTLYAVHANSYLKPRLRMYRSEEREDRRRRRLAEEMEKLRRMGYGETM